MGFLEQLLMQVVPEAFPDEESLREEEMVSEVAQAAQEKKPVRRNVEAASAMSEQIKEEPVLMEDSPEKKKFKVNPRDMIIYSEIMKPKYLE